MDSGSGGGAGLAIFYLIYFAVAVFEVAAMWKVFSKAGQPGWASIIPLYNLYVLLKITGHSGWWILLMFVPLVNFIISIIVFIDLARAFGKGTGFGIGLIFLSPIFIPILGFGDARYVGPSSGAMVRPATA